MHVDSYINLQFDDDNDDDNIIIIIIIYSLQHTLLRTATANTRFSHYTSPTVSLIICIIYSKLFNPTASIKTYCVLFF